ncbi:MAG: rhodanese-like domain-containing protein [Alphaproteobacteria bacterium]|nr:rhodanese-like domain-containing protein [Alphaproteobacteria bacterium]
MKIKYALFAFSLFLAISITSFTSYAIDLDARYCNDDYISPEEVDGVELVDTVKAYELWENRAVFIDTRSETAFESGRIPGAVHLPYEPGKENQPLTEESLAEVAAKDEAVVCYCNGIKCDRAPWCAALALEWGWTDVYYYRTGVPAWAEAGHDVE